MFEHILVPLDGSQLAECVLPHANAFAQAFNASIHLLAVQESTGSDSNGHDSTGGSSIPDPLYWNMCLAEKKVYLNSTKECLQAEGLKVAAQVLEGQAAENILTYAENEDIPLIILSSHGQSGITGWNISSTVQKLALRTRTSLMIVRAYDSYLSSSEAGYKNILLPLDASQRAEYALPAAIALARHHHARLHLAHVVEQPQLAGNLPPSPEQKALVEGIIKHNYDYAQSYLQGLQDRYCLEDVQTHILFSRNVPAALHDLVEHENIDLAVLSAHGHSGSSRWPFGSVTLSFLIYGSTPVLIAQDIPTQHIQKTRAEQVVNQTAGQLFMPSERQPGLS